MACFEWNTDCGKIIAIVLAFASAGASAEPAALERLDEQELRAAFAGKTHISRYRRHIEDYGGVIFEETYNVDGTLRYRAGDVAATGTWRIENGAICFRYDGLALFDACFVVAHQDGCYYSYEVLPDGSALGVHDDGWWIRSTIEGTDPDCAKDMVS